MKRFKTLTEDPMHDRELIKMLYKDPNNGLKLLMEKYTGLVYAVIQGKISPYSCFSTEDTEEYISDVFCEFYKNLDKFDASKGSVKTYLCAIAKNKAIDEIRKKASSLPPISIDDEDNVLQISDEILIEESVITEELKEALVKEICELGEPDKEIIVRKFYFSESSRSISQRLGLSVSSVDTRAHRALKKLKEKLGEYMI